MLCIINYWQPAFLSVSLPRCFFSLSACGTGICVVWVCTFSICLNFRRWDVNGSAFSSRDFWYAKWLVPFEVSIMKFGEDKMRLHLFTSNPQSFVAHNWKIYFWMSIQQNSMNFKQKMIKWFLTCSLHLLCVPPPYFVVLWIWIRT